MTKWDFFLQYFPTCSKHKERYIVSIFFFFSKLLSRNIYFTDPVSSLLYCFGKDTYVYEMSFCLPWRPWILNHSKAGCGGESYRHRNLDHWKLIWSLLLFLWKVCWLDRLRLKIKNLCTRTQEWFYIIFINLLFQISSYFELLFFLLLQTK